MNEEKAVKIEGISERKVKQRVLAETQEKDQKAAVKMNRKKVLICLG